jgi:hypothetical protein
MWNSDLAAADFGRVSWSKWHRKLRAERLIVWVRRLVFHCGLAAIILAGYLALPRLLRLLSTLTLFAVVLIGAALAYRYVAKELRTSELQASYLAELGRELTYRAEPGASDTIRFGE